MRRLAARLSRAIVRMHPRAWRERYAEEMLALIDDSGSTFAHTLDLAVGCADAWLRAALRFDWVSDWPGALLGAALVRIVSETAMFFHVIPPEPLRIALLGAFWLLAAVLFGSTLISLFLAIGWAFRTAWMQWFRLIHGRRPLTVVPAPGAFDMPSLRQVRVLNAVILIAAVGADFTRIDNQVTNLIHFTLPPVVPGMTYWMLGYVRVFLTMLRPLTSSRWWPRRVE